MRFLVLTALVAGALATTGAASHADDNDTVRLGGSVGSFDDDTQLVYRYHGGYGYRGGYHGGYGYRGGYHGGFYRGFGYGGYYGGYRGFGYRGYYGYRGHGFGYGYGGFYRPYYGFYAAPYYGAYYISPCNSFATDTSPIVYADLPSTYLTPAPALQQSQTPQTETLPFPAQKSAQSNEMRYDGGPRQPVPMPSDANPMRDQKRPTQPRDGLYVSLPLELSGNVGYSPYGSEDTIRVNVPPRTPTPTKSLSYPAYGESR